MDSGSEAYKRFLSGDKNAMAELIENYRDGLIMYLNSIVGNISLAEELAEDTFVRLGTRRPKDKGSGSFKTWLYTIGRNIAIDCMRRQSKNSHIPIEDIEQCLTDEQELEELIIKDERRIAVHKALSRLNDNYRQVIWLVYFDGMTAKQAGAVMKKKPHAVEVMLSRAKNALRIQLGKDGFDIEDI